MQCVDGCRGWRCGRTIVHRRSCISAFSRTTWSLWSRRRFGTHRRLHRSENHLESVRQQILRSTSGARLCVLLFFSQLTYAKSETGAHFRSRKSEAIFGRRDTRTTPNFRLRLERVLWFRSISGQDHVLKMTKLTGFPLSVFVFYNVDKNSAHKAFPLSGQPCLLLAARRRQKNWNGKKRRRIDPMCLRKMDAICTVAQ